MQTVGVRLPHLAPQRPGGTRTHLTVPHGHHPAAETGVLPCDKGARSVRSPPPPPRGWGGGAGTGKLWQGCGPGPPSPSFTRLLLCSDTVPDRKRLCQRTEKLQNFFHDHLFSAGPQHTDTGRGATGGGLPQGEGTVRRDHLCPLPCHRPADDQQRQRRHERTGPGRNCP